MAPAGREFVVGCSGVAAATADGRVSGPLREQSIADRTGPSPAAQRRRRAGQTAVAGAEREPGRGPGAVTKFVALVTSDGFTYQATFTGQDRHTIDILPISKGLLQVSGDDVRVQATFASRPARWSRSSTAPSAARPGSDTDGDAWRRMTRSVPPNRWRRSRPSTGRRT